MGLRGCVVTAENKGTDSKKNPYRKLQKVWNFWDIMYHSGYDEK